MPSEEPEGVAELRVVDLGGRAGDDTYLLEEGEWRALGNPPGSKGYRYRGFGNDEDPCRTVVLTPRGIRATCGDRGEGAITLDPPFDGAAAVVLTVGDDRYCAEFGGTDLRNDETLLKRSRAPVPGGCAGEGGGGGGGGGSGSACPAQTALDLVVLDQVTHTAAASGPWSATSTWADGVVPDSGSHVHVPQGLEVQVDTVLAARHATVRVDGTLSFANQTDTQLLAETIVSSHGARVEIGTAAAPIAPHVSASIVFLDDGPIDTTCDPKQLSRGALFMGTTVMHGAARTHRAVLASPALAGASSLTLTEAPQGWRTGDEIVVTGTVVGDPESDEIRRVASVAGAVVTLDAPLSLDHQAPAAGLNVYVANLTRNVLLSSENASFRRRGHVMFMHTLSVDVQNARFTELGRTDKTRPLDDLFFEPFEDEVGNETSAWVHFSVEVGDPSEVTNLRGRYPVHLHRGGIDPQSDPALVRGNVIVDSPGWGYVLHSGHGHFIDNVAYGVQGTAFYTEAGDEIGLIQGNIAIRSVNSVFQFDSEGGAIDPDLGAENQEFGNDGDGYWLSGHMVRLIDNVSAGSTAHGFIYWTDGLVEADIPEPGRTSVPVANIPNGHLIPGRTHVPTWWPALAEVRGNEAYGSAIGFRIRYVHAQTYIGEGGSEFHERPPQRYIDTLEPVIDDLTVWNNRDGVLLNYTMRMSVRNSRIVGIGAPFIYDGGTANTGVGLDLATEVTGGFGRIENVTIEGFEVGLSAPRNEQWAIEDLSLRNVRDVFIEETRQGPRTLTMRGVSFDPLAGTAVAGRESERIHVDFQATLDDLSHQPYGFVLPDHITLNGQGLYFAEQRASFVPLPEAPEPGELFLDIPAGYVGRTNQQLQASFGLSFGGGLPPPAATTDATIRGGLIGPPPPAATSFPPLVDMTNDGFSPEPFPGGPNPELTNNRLRTAPGKTVVLMRTNLNTTDTNSGPAELLYTVSGVQRGFFAHRDAPSVPITVFSQAEVDGGVIRFVHDGSAAAPAYAAQVTDGTTTTPIVAAEITFVP